VLVEAVQGVPIEALPGAAPVMESKVKQSQDGFVDSLFIDLHTGFHSVHNTVFGRHVTTKRISVFLNPAKS